MDTVFDFRRQLNVGNDGEALFKQHYADLKPVKSVDRSADFILGDGKKVELKTDTYGMEKTPNFFMEIYGQIEEGKLGGPWRAQQDAVEYFVYHYVRDKAFFWFETETLCAALDEMILNKTVKSRDIKNRTWVTRGYLVPREYLDSILFRKDIF